jgi:hypothetical protein
LQMCFCKSLLPPPLSAPLDQHHMTHIEVFIVFTKRLVSNWYANVLFIKYANESLYRKGKSRRLECSGEAKKNIGTASARTSDPGARIGHLLSHTIRIRKHISRWIMMLRSVLRMLRTTFPMLRTPFPMLRPLPPPLT